MRNAWLVLFLGLPALGQAQGPRVDIVAREADRRVEVTVDGKPFTSYIWPTTLKKPTIYPLHAASGVVVTRGWPLDPRPGERVDHPHQVGLWFDHGDVNGLDFWNNSDAIPAARRAKMGTILHRAVRRAGGGQGEGTLEVSADWVDSAGKPLLRVSSRSSGFPAESTQSALTSSVPSPCPPPARRTARCRIVPILARRAAGIASELFQKSSPFTSPWSNQS